MRHIAFMLLIVTALLEGSIVSFPLTLSIVVSIAMNWPSYSAPWLFAAGMILDMFTPRLWGQSSIFFLGMLIFIVRIQRKLSGKGLLFVAFFILFVNRHQIHVANRAGSRFICVDLRMHGTGIVVHFLCRCVGLWLCGCP